MTKETNRKSIVCKGCKNTIEEVIANEAVLVKPIVRLTPLAVLKG